MGSFNSKKENCDIHTAAKPLAEPAQITVARRESTGSGWFEAWEFYLNGENLGSIEDGKSATAETRQRKNVLTAKGTKEEFAPPYRFSVKSGRHIEVRFDGGAFGKARSIDTSAGTPEDPYAREALRQGTKQKIREWSGWTGLACYCTGVFFLSRGNVMLAFVLGLVPVIAFAFVREAAQREVAEYLSYHYPETWGEITRGLFTNNPPLGHRDLTFVEVETDDPEYRRLRKRHKRAFAAQIFAVIATLISIIYAAGTAAR